MAGLLFLAMVANGAANEFSLRSSLAQRLAAPFTTIVDGKPFRQSLVDIARQAKVNLWLDRRVDPTLPVAPGPVGPTVYAAFEKIARERGCVVMPVSNVVIVGRPDWVDAVAASLLAGPSSRRDLVDLKWSDLTTPQEAVSSVFENPGMQVVPKLPHDLWPEADLERVDRNLALGLIFAQFDRRITAVQGEQPDLPAVVKIQSAPLANASAVSCTYLSVESSEPFAAALGRVDPTGRIVPAGKGRIRVQASVAAHREALAAILAQPRGANAQGGKATFSLTAEAPAETLLIKLAQSAQLNCVIRPSAQEACQKVIRLSEKDATLKELIEQVGASAGVTIVWKPNAIEVTGN